MALVRFTVVNGEIGLIEFNKNRCCDLASYAKPEKDLGSQPKLQDPYKLFWKCH